MVNFREIIALCVGIGVALATWFFLRAYLQSVLPDKPLLIGSICGLVTVLFGVLANIGAEKILNFKGDENV